MIEFPKNIPNPSYPLEIIPIDNSFSFEFYDGSSQGLVKHTTCKESFKLKWNGLSREEFDVIFHFIKDTVHFKACTFLWTHPTTEKKYEVRGKSSPTFKQISFNQWAVEWEIQEV